MLRIASATKSLRAAALGLIGVFAALAIPAAAQAQNQPGRFLVSVRPDIVFECNLDASSCFSVTGSSQAAGDPGGGDQLGSSASEPSIASNGTIAFTALYGTNGTCAGVGAQGICQPHIFLMNADGTNVRQITFNPVDPAIASIYGGDRYAEISPDASMVAFISNRNPAGYDAAGNPISAYAVYVVNSDGSGLRQVTPFVYDVNGNEHGNMFSVAWSPDSKKLAFKGTSYGTFCGTFFGSPIDFLVVGLINVDGTGETFLACDNVNAAGGGNAIDWSPDGTLIADTRNSVNWGEPAIRITDLSGQGRFAAGLSLAELGVQSSSTGNGQVCPSDGHCIHFSPDSTKLAYENNGPSDNPSFYGVSIINLDGTGRVDSAAFGTAYAANLSYGIWWDAGAYPAPAAQMTLSPTMVEVWPGFSQQFTPSLLDANNSLILDTAQAYHITYVYSHNCGIQIGPFGLVMFSALVSGFEGSSILATNEGLTSNSVVFKCWASAPCTYMLGSNSENFPDAGGSGSIAITVDPGSSGSTCPWGPISNVPWITITSGSSGSGNGTIGFLVAGNTGSARQGTITIGGAATFTVSQNAAGSIVLQSISVSPSTASVAAGLTQQFTATGNYSDGSTKDLTTSVSWSSSNTGIATISNTAGSQGLATGVAAGGPVTITAAMGGISGTAQLTVTAPVLQSITVSPASASVTAGLTQQFSAMGHYSDSSSQNLTTSVTWSSSNTGIATISNTAGSQGLAKGISAGGPVTITAAQNSISGTAQLTVTAPVLISLTVTPANPSVPAGSTQPFTATGTYSDGSQQNITSSVTWASSNTAVATINASGVASALAAGSTTISAQQGSVSNSTTMTVITLQSLTISPLSPSIFVGSTLQFAATGHYNDGSTRDLTSSAVWTSSKTSVATITSPGGLATGVAKGFTTIKAAAGGFSASTTLTVKAVTLQSITVSPATATISVGGTQQFTATGNYNNGSTSDLTNTVTWSSSPKAVASVTSSGLATGLKPGTATISVKSGGISGSATLTVQ